MSGVLRRSKQKSGNDRYLLIALIAVELFMSFSFLGYIHIEPISLTFVYIPVLVAGCIMGPKESALVGAVFGLASMWKASAFYVGAGDGVFSPIMSGRPLESVLLSVGTRTLFGLIVGWLYYGAKKCPHPLLGIITVTSLGRTIHTVLVYSTMGLFFPEAGFGIANVTDDILRWDFIPFLFIANIITVSCYKICQSSRFKDIEARIYMVDRMKSTVVSNKRSLAVVIILVLLASFSVAVYFTNRIETVMAQYEIPLSEEISYDLMHLQIQFLLGMISLAMIVILVIVLYLKNFNFLYYEAKLDGLTGLLGRRQFFHVGNQLLKNAKAFLPAIPGCFVILDVDHFKEINDTFGHPTGDKVLKSVAENLQDAFRGKGVFGRLGGDEFVAFIPDPVPREEVEKALEQMKERIRDIIPEPMKVTCSIGVILLEKDCTLDELYRHADRLLYEAKKKGKDQFVFGYKYENPD